jgi:hypothetical protein
MSADQLVFIPPTVEELLATYRARLVDDLEDAVGRAVKADTKAQEAKDALGIFDMAMAARHTMPAPATESGQIGDAVPDKGDERPEAVSARELPAGVGVITVVGEGVEPFTMAVGAYTRFAALIYAMAEQLGITDVDDKAWEVIASDGRPIDSGAVIGAQFYGEAFVIQPALAEEEEAS